MRIKIYEASGSVGSYYAQNLISIEADRNLNFRLSLSTEHGEIEIEIVMSKLEILDLFDQLASALYEEN